MFTQFDFRHKQDVFMQVLLSILKALVNPANQVECRASLACHRFVSAVSDDAAYVLAVLQQELAEQIGVLVYEQSLRVCHFVLKLLFTHFPLVCSLTLAALAER